MTSVAFKKRRRVLDSSKAMTREGSRFRHMVCYVCFAFLRRNISGSSSMGKYVADVEEGDMMCNMWEHVGLGRGYGRGYGRWQIMFQAHRM
jgi:hypothetical protein